MVDSQPEEISLLVKTPSRAQEDQTVRGVRLGWTVKELKDHLAAVYPTKPAVEDQRLIYAGKLLPDHLNLRQLFPQMDSVPTLHLVLPLRNPSGPEATVTKQPPSSRAGSPPEPTSPTAEITGLAALRQRRPAPSPHGAPGDARGEAPAGAPPAFPSLSVYTPQQLLWLQHIYAQQYYLHYQAALAAAGSAPQTMAVPAHPAPVQGALANQNPIHNLAADQNPAQDGAFMDAGGANQDLRMNAQGEPVVENEDGVERDWLDWMYSAARFGVLLMIIYFNSNLSRFLLVTGTLLLMYLHTAGWFPFRRQAQVQAPDQQQPPEVQRQQEDQNPQPADDGTDRRRGEAPDEQTAVLVPPHRVSAMWTAWIFFKTFFSSLVPEAPQALN